MSYQNIKKNVNGINDLLDGKRQIQKIYSTSRFLCFVIRCFQKNLYLYLGRGKNFEGIWQGTNPPESDIRSKDKFLELLRKYVRNKSLSLVDLDKKDRIVKFIFDDGKSKGEFILGWIGRDCYFTLSTDEKKIISWKKDAVEIDFESFDDVGRTDIDKSILKEVPDIESLLQTEKNESIKQENNQKKENKKIKKIQSDIHRLEQFIKLKDQLKIGALDQEIDQHNMQIKKFGIKINFKDCKTIFQKKDNFFKKIKNVEKAIFSQKERLEKIKKVEKPKEELNNLKVIQPIWSFKQEKIEESEVKILAKNEFDIYQYENYIIGVGNSAQGNDQLRKWSKKDDYWVHLKDVKSAHAIIKCNDVNALEDALLKATNHIVEKSNKTHFEVDIIYTKVSNLKSVKGSPGMVNYKKEKARRIILK